MKKILLTGFSIIVMLLVSVNTNAQVLDYRLEAAPTEVFISYQGADFAQVAISIYPIPLTGMLSTWNAWIEGPNADNFRVSYTGSTLSSRRYIIRYVGPMEESTGDSLVVEATLLGLALPVRIKVPITVQP